MAYNKFIKKDGTVMLDLTDTTVSAETLAKDIIAVDKSGNKITGTLIIPEGTLDITENGEVDVTNYASANVNVPIPDGYIIPEGTIEITNTDEVNVTNYATAKVVDSNLIAENIVKDITILGITGTFEGSEDSPIPIEVSTEEEMTAFLTTGEIGSVYKYTGTTGTYENGVLYEIVEETDPLQGTWVFNDTIEYNRYGLNDVTPLVFNFTCDNNSLSFNKMIIQFMPVSTNRVLITYALDTDSVSVYNNSWADTIYKQITINSTYDELVSLNSETIATNFLSLLQANATKQPAKTFTKLILQSDLEEITITENGEYEGEYSKVTVEVESGGSAEFNIAYGDTEPTDTTKLWVKASEPSEVQVTTKTALVVDNLQTGIASLPTSAYGIGVASVGKYIYLFGGRGSSYLNTINVFDTETNTITTLDVTLPSGAYCIGVASVGKKVYLFGGSRGSTSYLNTINVFDTETNTITTLDVTLPSSAYSIGVASVGKKVYLFGGFDGGRLNTINVFDTETNTITTLGVTLPTVAHDIGVASVGTNIYLFGGRYDNYDYLNTINVFNTETNTITTLDVTLPTAVDSVGVASVGTNIYLFGGYGGSYLNTINVFNIETNTITTLDVTLPTTASYIGVASVGTNIYSFGGRRGTSSSYYLNTINAFILGLSLPTNNMILEATLFENTFNLLPNVEIGVKNVYIGNADGIGEKVEAALYKDDAWTDI